MKSNIAILKKIIVIALPLYIVHLLLFNLSYFKELVANFYYPLHILYFIFFILTTIVLLIVLKISEKNFDNTGMIFMIATSIKMVFAYFLVRPILQIQENKIEKINFFVIFVIFLLIETIIVAKKLNKKQ